MTEYLTTIELAQRWKKSPATLRNWRLKKVGPPYFKPAGEQSEALYRMSDILAWEETHTSGGNHE